MLLSHKQKQECLPSASLLNVRRHKVRVIKCPRRPCRVHKITHIIQLHSWGTPLNSIRPLLKHNSILALFVCTRAYFDFDSFRQQLLIGAVRLLIASATRDTRRRTYAVLREDRFQQLAYQTSDHFHQQASPSLHA